MKSIKKYFVHLCFLTFAFICLTIASGHFSLQGSPIMGNAIIGSSKMNGLFNQRSSIWFYLIVLSLFIGWTLGGKIGFVSNVLCYIGGYILAIINQYLNEPLTNLLANLGVENDSYIQIGASLIVLVLFLCLLKLIDKVLKLLVKMFFLQSVNNFLGSVLGIIEVCVGIGAFYWFIELYQSKKAFGLTVQDLPFFSVFKQIAENALGSAYLDWIKDFIDSLPS